MMIGEEMMMKKLSWIMLIMLVMVSICPKGEAITTELINKEKETSILQRIGMSSWPGDGVNRSIDCFDVNERGDVAIGMEGAAGQCYISVFDNKGQRLYGYSFYCHGKFYVEWEGIDNLSIYWVRSSVVGTFDTQANCVALSEYVHNTALNQRFIYLDSTERMVDGNRYYLDENLGILSPLALSYSRVICCAPDGQETVLVDMQYSNLGGALGVIALVAFIAITLFYSIKHYAY